MAHAGYVREKAVELRRDRGLTIDELAERLALSRSTIYSWVKGIPIGTTERQTAAQRRAAYANKELHRLLREAEYERGIEEYTDFLGDPTFRDFVTLFLTEGYKRTRHHVSISNSDPAAVALAHAWLRRLTRNAIRYRIQFHADQDIDELRRFWARRLRIDTDAIKLQRKSNSNRLTGRTWRSAYGVFTVEAGDTYLRCRLEAWMDCIRDEWEHADTLGRAGA